MASALNTSRKTSSSCPRFNLTSDCARPPVPTSWFLPHAGLHLATEHSQSQELKRGTHCRPVSPPHHLCPHSGDSWRHFFSSDDCVNNTNYCVVVLKCLTLSTTLILVNWTELNCSIRFPLSSNCNCDCRLLTFEFGVFPSLGDDGVPAAWIRWRGRPALPLQLVRQSADRAETDDLWSLCVWNVFQPTRWEVRLATFPLSGKRRRLRVHDYRSG